MADDEEDDLAYVDCYIDVVVVLIKLTLLLNLN